MKKKNDAIWVSVMLFFCKKSDPARARDFCISRLMPLLASGMRSNALAHVYFNFFSNTTGSKVSAYRKHAIIASAYRMS